MTKSYSAAGAAACTAWACLLTPVQAQTAAPDADPQRVEVIGTTVKTYTVDRASAGTKTDTPLLETPLSIQVVPQQLLQDQKVTTLDQALSNVSGVRSKNGGENWESIYLRGFNTLTTFHNGFRIDDLFGYGMKTMSNVDSVEVLKGPAAILYGRVEPGGIVNLVTKQPKSTPYYAFEQQAGSWRQYLTSVDATGPLNDDKTLLYRLNTSYQNNGSWRDGVQDNKLFIAPTVSWRISPKTRLIVEAEYTSSQMAFDSAQGVPHDTTTNQFVWLPRNQNLARYQHMPAETLLLGLSWAHDFNDDWSIKQQLNRHEFRQLPGTYYFGINDFTPGANNSWTVDRWMSRADGKWATTASILDLTGHFGTAGLKHTLLLGADYYRNQMAANFGLTSGFSTTTVIDPAPVTGLDIDPSLSYSSRATTNNTGLYVQDQVKLPHDVQLLAGWRWQRVARAGSFTDATGTLNADAPQSDHAVTPRFGILWQPSALISLYGNHAGNFGANNGRDWQGESLKPEGALQNEIGAKAQSLDGKLGATLALFELTKTDVAVCDVVHDPSCLQGIQMTVGAIRSRGLEFDAQGEVFSGLSVNAAYTHTDIVVTKSTSPVGGTYVQGNRMPNVPRNTASLWTTYELKAEALRGWRVGGGVAAYGSAVDSTNAFTMPGYTLVNAMASYEFKSGKAKSTLQLNVNNLFNRSYYTDLGVWGNGAYMQYGAPRSATASLKVEL